MTNSSFETSLQRLEEQAAEVAQLLTASGTDELKRSCQALQREVVQLSSLMVQSELTQLPVQQQRRLRRVHAVLAVFRENLTRQAVLAQHALATLVPASQAQTYAPALGPTGLRAWASAGRQSGEFKAFQA